MSISWSARSSAACPSTGAWSSRSGGPGFGKRRRAGRDDPLPLGRGPGRCAAIRRDGGSGHAAIPRPRTRRRCTARSRERCRARLRALVCALPAGASVLHDRLEQRPPASPPARFGEDRHPEREDTRGRGLLRPRVAHDPTVFLQHPRRRPAAPSICSRKRSARASRSTGGSVAIRPSSATAAITRAMASASSLLASRTVTAQANPGSGLSGDD